MQWLVDGILVNRRDDAGDGERRGRSRKLRDVEKLRRIGGENIKSLHFAFNDMQKQNAMRLVKTTAISTRPNRHDVENEGSCMKLVISLEFKYRRYGRGERRVDSEYVKR